MCEKEEEVADSNPRPSLLNKVQVEYIALLRKI